MLKTDPVEINGSPFTHTYSDSGFMIHKIGTEETYSEAYDVLDFEYEEIDIPIEEPEVEQDSFEIIDILTGEVE